MTKYSMQEDGTVIPSEEIFRIARNKSQCLRRELDDARENAYTTFPIRKETPYNRRGINTYTQAPQPAVGRTWGRRLRQFSRKFGT